MGVDWISREKRGANMINLPVEETGGGVLLLLLLKAPLLSRLSITGTIHTLPHTHTATHLKIKVPFPRKVFSFVAWHKSVSGNVLPVEVPPAHEESIREMKMRQKV